MGTTERAKQSISARLSQLLGITAIEAMALVENIIDIARDEAYDIVEHHERVHHDRDDDH